MGASDGHLISVFILLYRRSNQREELPRKTNDGVLRNTNIIIQFKPRESANLVSLAYEHSNLLFNQQASAEHYIFHTSK